MTAVASRGDETPGTGETARQRERMTATGLAGFASGQAFFAGVADAI